MTQITTALYQTLGEAYADVYDTLQLVDDGALTALNALVDVTTTGYSPGATAAVEIEVALLEPLNLAYTSAVNITNSTAVMLDAIRAINNHVINNISGSATANSKLTNWINSDMGVSGRWPNGAPSGWALFCNLAGYDVTGWNIEGS
jgi:hypothetical protein